MPSSTAINGNATAPPVEKSSRAVLEEQFGRLLVQNRAALTRLAASYTRSAGDRDDLCRKLRWRSGARCLGLPAFFAWRRQL
jgi:hypothetical protein